MANPVPNPSSKIRSKSRWASVLGTSLIASVLFHTPVLAQKVYENVKINPNSPAQTMRGISGGSVSASQVAGANQTSTGPCVGFVDTKPNHTMVLTADSPNLSIIADSPEDTTMVVKGPGGVWCNDDYQGKNPGIAGAWLAGTYKIWIGSYQKSQYYPYTIHITPGR